MKKRHRRSTTQQSVVAATAATVAIAVGSISQVDANRHDFSAFAFSPSSSSSSSFVHPTTTPARRLPLTTTRWNIVTPFAKHEPKDHVDEATPPPTRGRKKHKTHDPTETLSTNVPTKPRTQSFGAITYATSKSHGRHIDPDAKPVDIHTLILGTHPGIKSFQKSEYYGHPMNAFWWIAGDCLGFRRDTGISPSSGKPYQLTSHLRHCSDRILPSYQDQLQVLTSHGFALWDIVQTCQRPSNSSLDSHISQDQPNDIPQFCHQHRHSLKRIVLANGASGYSFFKKHFAQCLNSGEWQLGGTKGEESKKKAKNNNNNKNLVTDSPSRTKGSPTIQIIPALAVSPAAAKYTYIEKRDFWEKHVYQPGLQDFSTNQSSSSSSSSSLSSTPRAPARNSETTDSE